MMSGLEKALGINQVITRPCHPSQSNMSGSIDILVVKQLDGSLKSTPFHVRYGKSKCFKTVGKIVLYLAKGIGAHLRQRKTHAFGHARLSEGRRPLYGRRNSSGAKLA